MATATYFIVALIAAVAGFFFYIYYRESKAESSVDIKPPLLGNYAMVFDGVNGFYERVVNVGVMPDSRVVLAFQNGLRQIYHTKDLTPINTAEILGGGVPIYVHGMKGRESVAILREKLAQSDRAANDLLANERDARLKDKRDLKEVIIRGSKSEANEHSK